jgi:hypothetical protein
MQLLYFSFIYALDVSIDDTVLGIALTCHEALFL